MSLGSNPASLANLGGFQPRNNLVSPVPRPIAPADAFLAQHVPQADLVVVRMERSRHLAALATGH